MPDPSPLSPAVLARRARILLRLGRDAARVLPEAWARTSSFDEVETFCLFVGYSRSGHSLVAACLDAHRHAAIAHEQKTLLYVHGGFRGKLLSALLLRNTETVGHTRGWRGRRPYDYEIPWPWQGRVERLRVLGDKDGEDAACRFESDPWLLDRLRQAVDVPVRFVHVVRNPFDNVATMANRAAETGPFDLAAAVARYRYLVGANAQVLDRVGDAALTVHHDAFVAHPEAELGRLCRWLGLDPEPDYLAACASIVFERPRRTRDSVEWPAALRTEIEALIDRTPFLSRYSFDG